MKTTKLWTKDFILLMFANMFFVLVYFGEMTVFAAYSLKTYNAGASLSGFTASIFIFGAVFSRIFVGRYLELWGRRQLSYLGGLIFILTSLSYFIKGSIFLLLFFRLIHGFAFGLLATVLATLAVHFIPEERRGEGLGYFALSTTISTALGPSMGIYLTQRYDYNLFFGICALFAVCSFILMLFIRIENMALTAAQRQNIKKGFGFSDFFEIKAVPFSSLMIIWGICYAGITAFINSYSVEIKAQEAATVFFLIYAVFMLVSRPLAGKLLDQKGDNVVMYPAIIFYCGAMLLLGFTANAPAFLFSSVLLAFGIGNIISCGQAIAVRSVPAHRVSKAISTYFICLDGGIGIGPVLLGLIVPRMGYAGMYILAGALVAVSILLYYLLHGRHVKRMSGEKLIY